jgi:hypothetical protein
MSSVFRNIDPPTPSPPGECVPPAFGAGEDTLARRRWGGGANSSEDARHYSVLYIRKYFVPGTLVLSLQWVAFWPSHILFVIDFC